MDRMISNAPFANMVMRYDRNEINSPITQICSSCDGWGKQFYSNCCGQKIVNKKCSDCGDDCRELWDRCEQCNGDGEVEL